MKRRNQKSNAHRLGRMFNILGHFYNPLKRVFLANQPENAITNAVNKMDFHSSMLVVGGGADNTLIELLSQKKCANITHIDISSVLSKKAKDRIVNQNKNWLDKVCFRTLPFLDFQTDLKFDAVVCPFYLDLFTEWEVRENIEKMNMLLIPQGVVYVVDFLSNPDVSKQNVLLIKLLYALFYPFTGIYRTEVPNYKEIFKEFDFELVKENTFFKNRYQVLAFRRVS